jgi:hypothetical protein
MAAHRSPCCSTIPTDIRSPAAPRPSARTPSPGTHPQLVLGQIQVHVVPETGLETRLDRGWSGSISQGGSRGPRLLFDLVHVAHAPVDETHGKQAQIASPAMGMAMVRPAHSRPGWSAETRRGCRRRGRWCRGNAPIRGCRMVMGDGKDARIVGEPSSTRMSRAHSDLSVMGRSRRGCREPACP